MEFNRLLEPIRINQLELPNRLIQPAMVTNYCHADGLATDKFIAYHERRARGGWGLIITEDYAISPKAGGYVGLPGLWSDEQIPSHRAFVGRIHAAGGRIAAQIYHAGRETSRAITGEQPVAPSAIRDPTMPDTPRALTVPEIRRIVSDFAECAFRVKQAGFDAVEIHGAHGYLICEFLSPFSNKRADEYGGTIVNRARFAVEVTQAVRAKVGPDYPIIYRMSTQEYVPGGLTLAETQIAAKLLQEAGVDCFHCAQGTYLTQYIIVPPFFTPKAPYIDNAAAIRSVVDVPVIAVGKINDPYLAESVIEQGKADMVSMGRGSIADAEAPRKIMEGRADDVRRCIGCVQGCVGENFAGEPIRCTLDPLTGMEDEYVLEETAAPRKILVVGGGVSGCETAIIAAKRGHEVTLCERETELGGQWLQAAAAVAKSDFAGFVGWQSRMLERYGVDVLLDTECDQAFVDSGDFDVIVDATGSVPAIPPIAGLTEIPYLNVEDIFERGEMGEGKVVVIGGGLSGSEVAEHLAVHGAEQVVLIEMLDQIAADGVFAVRRGLIKNLAANNVEIITGARVTQVGKGVVEYQRDGSRQSISGVGTIVLASGVRSAYALEGLDLSGHEVYAVGDAARAKDGYHNIREGYELGLRL